MSLRTPPEYTKRNLILAADSQDKPYEAQKKLICAYKKAVATKEKCEKKLEKLQNKKSPGSWTLRTIARLENKIESCEDVIRSTESSPLLTSYYSRKTERIAEQKRRASLRKTMEALLDMQESNLVPPTDDEEYDRLWKTDRKTFWIYAKKQWFQKNQLGIYLDGVPLEERCNQLSYMESFSVITHQEKIPFSQMRRILSNKGVRGVETMCVLEVFSAYDLKCPSLIL